MCVCVAYMYMSLLGGMYVCGDVSCNMKVDPISGTVIRRSRGEKNSRKRISRYAKVQKRFEAQGF